LVADPAGDFRPPTPAELREIVAYTMEHRSSTAPFEVAVGESLSGSEAPATEVVGPYAEAGATWWLEAMGALLHARPCRSHLARRRVLC
jgi:hypothetical protein